MGPIYSFLTEEEFRCRLELLQPLTEGPSPEAAARSPSWEVVSLQWAVKRKEHVT